MLEVTTKMHGASLPPSASILLMVNSILTLPLPVPRFGCTC